VDGSSSKGDYFTDAFEIGGATLSNLTMGLGRRTDIAYGLVGVGYAVNEAIVGTTQSLSSVYPNLPVDMVNEGLINTVAYSLWLNDLGTLWPTCCRLFSLLMIPRRQLGQHPLRWN
jgi:elongation factor G